MHVLVWKGALYEEPFSFTKKGNGKKNCEEKVGKSKAKVWEKKKKKH